MSCATSGSPAAAYAAFAWSVTFLVPHVYWAAGGTAGLDGEPVDGVLAAVNAAAIVLSVAAAALELALVQRWAGRCRVGCCRSAPGQRAFCSPFAVEPG